MFGQTIQVCVIAYCIVPLEDRRRSPAKFNGNLMEPPKEL